MWGNLFSSRGYREMRLEGLIEGQKAITQLTDAFQPRFENELPDTFRFEDFLVWLFAFEGIPEEITSWSALMKHLLEVELGLTAFKPPYCGRFRLADPEMPWPQLLKERPTNEQFLQQLAPKLFAYLANPVPDGQDDAAITEKGDELGIDDPVLATLKTAIQAGESLSFLLVGPPGTGKTRYARQLALDLTDSDKTRALFLQFHPAIGYDDFIEGFRPIPVGDGSGVKYDLAPRLFLNFAKLAVDKPEQIFVAVIDELNRGDVARIFGEVLTYLEVDYRGIEFTLPFSGKPALLPKNLIVIATANPYDRSVTDLDDA
jgi:5-methylcytosine-specific restriction protein B